MDKTVRGILFCFWLLCSFAAPAATHDDYSWQALTAELRAEFPMESPLALAKFARALRNYTVAPEYFIWRTDRAEKLVRLWNLARSGQAPGRLAQILPFYTHAPRCAGLIRTQLAGLNPAEFRSKLFFAQENTPIQGAWKAFLAPNSPSEAIFCRISDPVFHCMTVTFFACSRALFASFLPQEARRKPIMPVMAGS